MKRRYRPEPPNMKQQYPPKVGERFGRFILLRHLGQGGMGNVYKARVEGANGFVRHVAIKLILREHADDPRFVEMFTDEAKIASLLSHRNIVQVYELGRQDDELFIEMEFVRGWDCRQLLHLSCQRGGPPPPLVAAYIVHEVARGLQYAHEYIDEYDQPRSIVHCDISPQNIVIDRYGQVKLVDFGIAMALTVKNRASSALLQGKLGYMAPELWTDRVYTPQTDIFATGVVLYELLTGKCPNESTTCDKIIHRGNREQDGFSDIMRLDIPSELAAITMKALAREPSERYQHASQLANDLGAVLQSRRFSVEQVEAWLKSICPGGQDEQRAIGSTNDGPRPDPRIADLDPHRTRSVQIKGNSLSVTAEVSGLPHAAASIDGSQSSGAADHRPRDVHILEPGSRQSGVLSRAAASHRLYVGVVTAVALMLLRSSAFHEATLALKALRPHRAVQAVLQESRTPTAAPREEKNHAPAPTAKPISEERVESDTSEHRSAGRSIGSVTNRPRQGPSELGSMQHVSKPAPANELSEVGPCVQNPADGESSSAAVQEGSFMNSPAVPTRDTPAESPRLEGPFEPVPDARSRSPFQAIPDAPSKPGGSPKLKTDLFEKPDQIAKTGGHRDCRPSQLSGNLEGRKP